jgi:hypothetical protein
MATKKKMLEAAAGNAGGAGGLNVEEVFSTYLYTGTGSTLNIVNGIDLAGEGGLVWHKYRGGTSDHGLFDTERGVSRKLASNNTDAQTAAFSGYGITAFNSDGYTLGTQYSGENGNGNEVVSWTFRKAPKFFDVVTYTGDGAASKTISHNLGATPACIFVKVTSGASDWKVYHSSVGNTGALYLNTTASTNTNSLFWNNTSPTSTDFTVGGANNGNGATYVAYLFAHNDGDGEFGPTGDQDIIKCGSYTGNGSSNGPEIDLGFEPQWVLIKSSSLGSEDWVIFDNMRGVPTGGADQRLYPSTSGAESANVSHIDFNATGFKLTYGSNLVNNNTNTYIYIAIRRGPMGIPESASDVFSVSDGSAGASGNAGRYRSGFTVDMGLERDVTGTDNWEAVTRMLQGTSLRPNGTNAEDTGIGNAQFDYMDGWNSGSAYSSSYSWMWKRAPSFFDVVAYSGDSVSGRTVSHNLGVAPEMIWVKQRDVSRNWTCYFETLGTGVVIKLNDSTLAQSKTQRFDTAPTDSVFYLGSDTDVNSSGGDYIAYLFASLDGVSKVGSYTGNGSSQTIDCGFSSGARFVLIKRTDSTGGWLLFDAERGIVSGNDPYLSLNTSAAQSSNFDVIDPVSSGFVAVNSFVNTSGASYIFYAIA